MGRPHKFAGSRLTARTTLTRARVLELGQASAAAAVGNRWDGRSETRLLASGPDGDAYAIHGAFLHKPKQLDFRLRVTEAEDGARRDVATQIGWYLTTQMKAYWFIPVGAKKMVALHVYLQFMEDLGQRIRAEDPRAAITIRKGEQVVVSTDGSAAAPVAAAVAAAAPAPVAPAAPAAAAAPVPTPLPPGGRACAACSAVADDDDVYCGQCGTALPAAAPAPTGEAVL